MRTKNPLVSITEVPFDLCDIDNLFGLRGSSRLVGSSPEFYRRSGQ